MAKRFTDTAKYDHAWFRKLPPRLKCAWDFLLHKCDHAGIWNIDFDAMQFHVGERIDPRELESALSGRIIRLADEKYFIPTFIDFQYGELNPSNRVHLSVIHRLEKCGANKAHASPLEGAKDKDKDKDKETDKDQEKETDKEKEKPRGVISELAVQVGQAGTTWLETLEHFKMRRPVTQQELQQIGRAIQRWGFEAVDTALLGARFEPSGEGYNPADHVSISRVLERDKHGVWKFDKFLNWGARHLQRQQARHLAAGAPPAAAAPVADEAELSPEEIRATIAKHFRTALPAGGAA